MYKYILFIVLYFITIFSYNFTKKRYLSPTFISSAMFTMFVGAYIIFYRHMGRDILPITMSSIILSELGILIGEILAENMFFHRSTSDENSFLNNKLLDINISNSFTVSLSIVILVIAWFRIRILQSLYGGSLIRGLSGLITNTREDSVSGLVSFGPILSALYYFSLCTAYVYAFVFVQKLISVRKIELIYLLPVLSYCVCIVSTTSRSEFIRLACAFIAAALLCSTFRNKKKINLAKASIFAGLFIIFFLWYGFSVRGITFSGGSSIWSNVVGYSCASIYGLDEYLRTTHITNELFGKYTFEYIYTLFGKEILNTIEKPYVMAVGHSNIYTSLVKPIQDFGIWGMIFEKLFFSFVSVKIINKCINKEFSTNKFYFLFIIVTHILYIYLMSPIGEKASYLYLNPGYLVRITISFLILIFIGFKVQYQFDNRFFLSTNRLFKITFRSKRRG